MRYPSREEALKRWLLGALLALAMASAIAQQRLTLNFVNSEIEAVARAMADFTGRPFIVDPRVKGTVTLNIDQPLTPAEAVAALSSALRLQSVAVVESGGVFRIVPEADAKVQGGAVNVGPASQTARGDQIVTQVFRLSYESATSIAQLLRPLVAPNNTIAAYAANNTIVITDYAENVRRIARIIAAIDTPAGSDIDVVRLEHTVATDVAITLGRLLETPGQGVDAQRVSVLAEPASNTLLIRAATPARANLVRVLVAKLDQPSSTPGNIHVVYL